MHVGYQHHPHLAQREATGVIQDMPVNFTRVTTALGTGRAPDQRRGHGILQIHFARHVHRFSPRRIASRSGMRSRFSTKACSSSPGRRTYAGLQRGQQQLGMDRRISATRGGRIPTSAGWERQPGCAPGSKSNRQLGTETQKADQPFIDTIGCRPSSPSRRDWPRPRNGKSGWPAVPASCK